MSKKYIFITGGASGMGKSTVQLFIDKGWFVGCYDINKNNLNALEEEINSENLIFSMIYQILLSIQMLLLLFHNL